jgi:hypothetical protein
MNRAHLGALIKAVEAGTGWISVLADATFADKQCAVWACRAYGHEGRPGTEGSLDAAMALHKALLPGCRFAVSDGDEGSYYAEVFWGAWYYAENPDPARAWLLAILRALEAGEAGG